jgi:high affinity Mn2+ porin
VQAETRVLTERRYLAASLTGSLVLAAGLLAPGRAFAQPMPPAAHEDDSFDIMNELAHRGLHDINDESWNLYGQFTYITSYHPSIPAAYTNVNGSVNSLWTQPERGYTSTFTLFGAVRLWHGGEAYVVPEFIAERAFSDLRGLGGSTENFELQKTGSAAPTLYRSRLYLRQTFDLGGERVEKTSDPMQLAATTKSRRLVLQAGNYAVIDVFDRNNVVGDLRQSFFNEAFMTHGSFDFPADSRGYTWGADAELYLDDWVLRLGRFAPPTYPNDYGVDLQFWNVYGDELEIEHDHKLFELPGAVRLQGYRNRDLMGSFGDAIAAFESNPAENAANCGNLYNFGSGNWTAPDLCWVRKVQVKLGVGINVEQAVAKGIGVFGRFMWSDGNAEVDAYDSADRDVSFGVVAKGRLWRRPLDVAGIGFEATWISAIHAKYLEMGGMDDFIGDGRLRPAPEELFETFYSVNFFRAIWLAADYQIVLHPAYSADRGPENVFAGRVHAEF